MSAQQHSLTHLDDRGRVRMVDVGHKDMVRREAVAEGYLVAAAETLERLEQGTLPKGEALAAARIAAILAAKRTDLLIPLCHALPIEAVLVDFHRGGPDRMRIVATASVTGRTGVEMEALVAVSAAALTIYDMCKSIDRAIRIDDICLVKKTGGKSGTYLREEE